MGSILGSGAIEIVCRAGVLSESGVVMMGSIEVTMLHPRGPGDPKLPSTPDVVQFLSEDSLRGLRRGGDPMWTIPMNMAPESRPWGRNLGGQNDRQ
jgi:hypothetical protein